MGRYQPGNFTYHSNVIPARELTKQVDKFAYLIWKDRLCKDSRGNLFIEPTASLERKRNGFQEILVKAVEGGFEVVIVGDPLLDPDVPSDAKPTPRAIPVVRLKVRNLGRSHNVFTQWDDELHYYTLASMSIGGKQEWYIDRYSFTVVRPPHRYGEKGLCRAHRNTLVAKKSRPTVYTRVPVRRLGKDEYEIMMSKMSKRGWVPLIVW